MEESRRVLISFDCFQRNLGRNVPVRPEKRLRNWLARPQRALVPDERRVATSPPSNRPGTPGPVRITVCTFRPFWPNVANQHGNHMKTLSAKDAKYGFGRLIDLARAEPVAVAKHG